MGQYLSKDDLELIDSSIYFMPYNKDLKLSCWESYNAKNFEYYSGDRFFKISRKNYRDYSRGIIWGYYYNGDGYVSAEEELLELAF